MMAERLPKQVVHDGKYCFFFANQNFGPLLCSLIGRQGVVMMPFQMSSEPIIVALHKGP